MARRKIPPEAFDFYFSLGPRRSYEAVAEKYGVTKRAVTKAAARENWQRRMAEVEAKARERSDQQKAEALDAAREQHLKALRLLLGKGIEALRERAIDSPRDAIRAITGAVREIRVELGEPSERTAVSIENIIKREYERWMTPVESEESSAAEPEKDGEGSQDDGEDPP